MTPPAQALSKIRPEPRRRAGFARIAGFVVPVLLAFGLGRAAQAGVDRWTPYGPGASALQSLVASTRGELYVSSTFTLGEIWQRPSANTLWRWRGAGLGLPALPGITAIAIHPKNPNALWAVATNSGGIVLQSVFRSTDAGASWRKVSTGTGGAPWIRLTVAPTANSVVLLAEAGYGPARPLLRSTDLGVSWSEVAGIVGPVAAPPDEPGTVYAVAASGLAIEKSVDGGKTFHPAGTLPIGAGDGVRALHATYGRPALVLASLRAGGLFRSTNGGGLWRSVGFLGSGPGTLASEPGNPKKIYATNALGLYASDLGAQRGSFRTVATFNFTPLALQEPTALVAAPGGPYFLAANELYRFSAQDFGPVDETGIEAFGVAELRISPVDPNFVALRRYLSCLATVCNLQTLLSTDGGATFSRLGTQLSPRLFADVADLAFDPAEPRRRLEVIGGLILLHQPDGTGGQVFAGPIGTVEIAANGALLVGGSDGIHQSENDGTTWTRTLEPVVPISPEHPRGGSRQVFDLVTDPYVPEKVVARTLEFTSGLPRDRGDVVLYRSTDRGATWSKLRDGEADVEFIPGAPSSFYLLFDTVAGTELRRSDDFGTTSTLIHTFPTSDVAADVATDPSGSSDLYLATRTGVRRSRDGGATWQATAGGFNPFGPYRRWVGRVQVAPDGRLIAAPINGGLFENRLSN